MDETTYHRIVDGTLSHYAEKLEPAFENGVLDDLDLQGGVLTLVTARGTTLVISKHTASKQLWLASPVSGGLHFSYDMSKQLWYLPDGRLCDEVIVSELKIHGIDITL
jgi:CyaY protein